MAPVSGSAGGSAAPPSARKRVASASSPAAAADSTPSKKRLKLTKADLEAENARLKQASLQKAAKAVVDT